jgi:hypothetical protein
VSSALIAALAIVETKGRTMKVHFSSVMLAVVLVLGVGVPFAGGASARIPARWRNCKTVNAKYPHGVGKVNAHDCTASTKSAVFFDDFSYVGFSPQLAFWRHGWKIRTEQGWPVASCSTVGVSPIMSASRPIIAPTSSTFTLRRDVFHSNLSYGRS